MGNDRYMYKVDEDPEVRTGSIPTSCAPGDYTVEVSISSPGNVELASATAGFTVNAPAQQQEQPEPALDRRHTERPDAERCHPGVRISHDRVHRQCRQ